MNIQVSSISTKAICALALSLISATSFAQNEPLTAEQLGICARNAIIVERDIRNLNSTYERLGNERSRIQRQEAWLLAEKSTLQSMGNISPQVADNFNRRLWSHHQQIADFNNANNAWKRARDRVNRQSDEFDRNCTGKSAPTDLVKQACSAAGDSDWCRGWNHGN